MQEELLNELENLLKLQQPKQEEELVGAGAINPDTGDLLFITNYRVGGTTACTIRNKITVNQDSYNFTLIRKDKPEITITVNDIVEATVDITDLICKYYDIDREFLKDAVRNRWLEPMETLEIIGRT